MFGSDCERGGGDQTKSLKMGPCPAMRSYGLTEGRKAIVAKTAELPNPMTQHPADNNPAHQINSLIKSNADCNIVVFLGPLPPPDCLNELLFFYTPPKDEETEM